MFLSFLAWYLATLYIQRSADVAFEVHQTMVDVLDPVALANYPGPLPMAYQTGDQIYTWMNQVLTVR